MKYVVCLSIIALVITVSMRSRITAHHQTVSDEVELTHTEDVTPVIASHATQARAEQFEAVATTEIKEPQGGEDQLEEILYERDMQELFSSIPRLGTEESPDYDGHGFNSVEMKEAEALSTIQDMASKNKNFPAVTQKLYRQCTDDRELASTVRALCYFHVLELSTELHNTNEVAQLDVPSEIKKMAQDLYN